MAEPAKSASLKIEDDDVSMLPNVRLPDSAEPPDPDNPPKPLTWVVLGSTSRLGTALVHSLLQRQERVCAVGWTHGPQSLADMRALHLSHLSTSKTPSIDTSFSHYLPLQCDVRLPASIQSVLSSVLAHFGTVDVVANFVSVPLVTAACEDEDEAVVRRTWDTVLTGGLGTLQAFLPLFLEKRKGRFIFCSQLGFHGGGGVPGVGAASAAAAALEGVLESLALESETEREIRGEINRDGVGIRVTMVSPGFLDGGRDCTSSMPSHHPRNGRALDPFKPLFTSTAASISPAHHVARARRWAGAWSPTSASACAEVLWQLGHCRVPPVRLALGSFAVEAARERCRALLEELEDWRRLGFAGVDEGDVEGEWEGDGDGEGGVGEGE